MSTTDYVEMMPNPDDHLGLSTHPHKINYKFLIFFTIGYISPIGIFYLGLYFDSTIIVLSAAMILLLVIMIAIKYRDAGMENKSNKSHALWISLIIILIVIVSALIHLYHEQNDATLYLCIVGYCIGFILGLYGSWHRKSVKIDDDNHV